MRLFTALFIRLTIGLTLFALSGCRGGGDGSTSPAPHHVTLTWQMSTSSGVIGYHMFRGGTSGGPYTLIGTSTILSYDDQNVTPGAQYYYVVTAYTIDNESIYSNEAAASIPNP